jgi:hypothetical protein
MSDSPAIRVERLSSWRQVVEAVDFLTGQGWVFRGHERLDWTLQTSLEREFGRRAATVEGELLWRFVRSAPRSLESHLVPADNDAAAWLGLIQHYGGPTRLLDVTRSPYVALYFAFEASGDSDRALWAIEATWCMAECARIMSTTEGIEMTQALGRATGGQAQVVYSLVHGRAFPDPSFRSFKPFTGIFPVEPWKPDSRQSAQQAMFLCAANADLSFMRNLAAHSKTPYEVLYQFVMPADLREEAIERLSTMNVSAATLFPDLSGLARSLRTYPIRRRRNADAAPPWEPGTK